MDNILFTTTPPQKHNAYCDAARELFPADVAGFVHKTPGFCAVGALALSLAFESQRDRDVWCRRGG